MDIDEHARQERKRCVQICRRRAALWQKTSMVRSMPDGAREEARARANEATYLADLLESGADVDSDTPASGP
jgi:hypothetical protein